VLHCIQFGADPPNPGGSGSRPQAPSPPLQPQLVVGPGRVVAPETVEEKVEGKVAVGRPVVAGIAVGRPAVAQGQGSAIRGGAGVLHCIQFGADPPNPGGSGSRPQAPSPPLQPQLVVGPGRVGPGTPVGRVAPGTVAGETMGKVAVGSAVEGQAEGSAIRGAGGSAS